jgi:hypothetical protein
MSGKARKLNILGAIIVSVWFIFIAYKMINNSKYYGEEFSKNYAEFYSHYQSNWSRKV